VVSSDHKTKKSAAPTALERRFSFCSTQLTGYTGTRGYIIPILRSYPGGFPGAAPELVPARFSNSRNSSLGSNKPRRDPGGVAHIRNFPRGSISRTPRETSFLMACAFVNFAPPLALRCRDGETVRGFLSERDQVSLFVPPVVNPRPAFAIGGEKTADTNKPVSRPISRFRFPAM
jgi:hypothetical protein